MLRGSTAARRPAGNLVILLVIVYTFQPWIRRHSVSEMDLCSYCVEFAIAISKRSTPLEWTESRWDATSIRTRSRSCPLCKMISDHIFIDGDSPIQSFSEKIYFEDWPSPDSIPSLGQLSGLNFRAPSLGRVGIAIWADQGMYPTLCRIMSSSCNTKS